LLPMYTTRPGGKPDLVDCLGFLAICLTFFRNAFIGYTYTNLIMHRASGTIN
jgi:hypothetical protein